ncbi:hypothetical protein [Paenibacillus sp. MDMC362]|uniref:hypothetical protein n=1 Tax=Paenibacillus sp. MDMC362 TaxID=2977365 RepID=UPI00081EA3ED|nr:hypothetical protein [Paenibacillus sp. MDMC362]ORT78383.1 hypothetical protein BS299_22005 [Mycobacterium tuberculosis M13]RAR28023.1 hypothetical protein DP092_25835 [Pseudomonas sp. MDMC224]SIP65829.1 hypothetical protein BN9982_2380004 [Mycobacterium tuberculosis]SME40879.1 Uncharacterised protein [Klebsiella pneumoniae]
MTRPERKFPQLALRLDLLQLVLQSGLGDALLSAIRHVGEAGEPLLSLETPTGTLLLPLCLEPIDL